MESVVYLFKLLTVILFLLSCAAFKGVFAVRQAPYQILPGDAFRTSCFIHSDDEGAIFGSKSVNEMCNSVLVYYPAKRLLDLVSWICIYDIPLAACNASYETSLIVPSSTDVVSSSLITSDSLSSPSDQYLERTFGYNFKSECSDTSSTMKGNATSATSGRSLSIYVTVMALSSATFLLLFNFI
jgi:Copper type II ascorbate-dependent monooxygenase, C-terminal domain